MSVTRPSSTLKKTVEIDGEVDGIATRCMTVLLEMNCLSVLAVIIMKTVCNCYFCNRMVFYFYFVSIKKKSSNKIFEDGNFNVRAAGGV